MNLLQLRVNKLRQLMKKNSHSALLVTKMENIYYLSGFTGTSACLLITFRENFLFTDFRYMEQAAEQSPNFIIKRARESLMEAAAEEIGNLNETITSLAFEGKNIVYDKYKKLKDILEEKDLLFASAGNIVENLRAQKDREELDCICRAAKIGLNSLEKIKHLIKPGIKEKDIALELEYLLKKEGAAKAAFDIIVASGKRSALPHGVATEKKLEEGDTVVIDWGCQVKGYHSDCTRTFFVGKPEDKWVEIYDIVKEAQQKALNSLLPGMQGVEVDKIARNYIKDKGYGEYFGHGLGHGVGLEVHENPTLSPKSTETLEAGMVVTIEPGIYLPGEGGVRLEELVLLKENGPKILTA